MSRAKIGQKREEGSKFWDSGHGNQSIHEEPREPSRKGDISATMGHTRLQGRTRRERILEASRRQKLASRIRTSGVPGGHRRHDRRGSKDKAMLRSARWMNDQGRDILRSARWMDGQKRANFRSAQWRNDQEQMLLRSARWMNGQERMMLMEERSGAGDVKISTID